MGERRRICPFQYTRLGIQRSTRTAEFLKDLDHCKKGLNQQEIDFIDETTNQFSWNPQESARISNLWQKVFKINLPT